MRIYSTKPPIKEGVETKADDASGAGNEARERSRSLAKTCEGLRGGSRGFAGVRECEGKFALGRKGRGNGMETEGDRGVP